MGAIKGKMQGIMRHSNGKSLVQNLNGKVLKGSGQKQNGMENYSTRRSMYTIPDVLDILIKGQCG